MAQPSPYTPGSPSEFPFGRAAQLAEVDERLDLMVSLHRMVPRIRVDHGPRGLGKTSLLRQVQRVADHRGAVTCWVTGGGSGTLIGNLSRSFERVTRDEKWQRTSGLRETLNRLSVTMSVGVPGVAQVSAARAAQSPEDTLRPTVQDFKDALLAFMSTALREGRTGVVMLVDEIQDVDVMSLSVVGRAWQELQSEAADQPFAMFTAGLPSSLSWVTQAATFLERADMHEVPPLPADGTRLALTNLAAQRGVSWDPQALEAAVLYSAGHPYVMQLVGDNVWKAAGRPEPGAVLTMEHVMTATISATTGMGGLFRARWDRASAKEQQVLAAIARTGHDKPVARRDIEASTGMDHSELSMQRTRLIDKGLIGSPTRGMLAFTIPGFGAWILAHLDESPQSIPSRAELLQQLQQLHAQLQAMGPAESPNAGELQTSAGLDWQPGQETQPSAEPDM